MSPRDPCDRKSTSAGKTAPGTDAAASSAPSPGPFGKHTVLVLLLLILLVGAGLRFYGLSIQSLWLDELWTWQAAKEPTLTDVLTRGRLTVDVHPPLFFMIEHFLLRYVGDSETIMRLPSAVAGVLSVLVIYLLGRRLYSDTEGLIAAALTAVLVRPIYYSQEARANAMMILFAMLTIYFWIPLVRSLCRMKPPKPASFVGFVASTVILAYLHYYGLYFVGMTGLAAAVVLLIKRPKAAFLLPFFYLPVPLLYLPWLPVMLKTLKTTRFGAPAPPLYEIFWFVRWVFNPRPAFVSVVVFAVLGWLLGVTIYDALRKKTGWGARPATPHAGLLLVLWLVVPYVGVHLQAALWRPTYMIRSLLVCMPAAYLLAARGIARIPLRARWHTVITVVVSLALVAQLLFGIRYYSRPRKDQYREAVGFVVENNAKYPRSVIIGWRCPPQFYDFYFRKHLSVRKVNLWAAHATHAPGIARVIASARPRPEHIWLIAGHWKLDEDFTAFMKARYSLLEERSFKGAVVLLFKNEPPRP